MELQCTLFASLLCCCCHVFALRQSKKLRCIYKLKQFCSETSDSLSLSIKYLQLSAVRDVWLFMMTICVLFVMIALHQHSTLQPSQSTVSDIFPPSARVLLLLSGLPDLALPPLLALSAHVQGLHLSTSGEAGGQAPIFFNTGCWACLVVCMSGWTQQGVV